ncbi:MAG: LD-carboxypeptidase [Lachnospiraceae bacterium]|nr:LD-carboxypeptidase [Lachnospiraceae bacterium]
MRYPKFLPPKGTIGLIAPSFGASTEPYISRTDFAEKLFESKGYKIKEGPNAHEDKGIGKSNTPEKCADEFMDFYRRKDVDVLISCGGGETMCEDLSFVDWDSIRKADPKWFMGYSDNTNFTYLLTTLCDTASIYGPCISGFAMHTLHESLKQAESLLTGEGFEGNGITFTGFPSFELSEKEGETDPCADLNLNGEKKLVFGGGFKRNVPFTGRLLGGCIDCLVTLLGTRFDKTADFLEKYREDGFIWFLESCDLNPISLRRAFWQMDEAGWFKYVKGFVIGRPFHFGEEMFGMNMYDAVLGVIEKYNVPVIMDADLGHLPPAIPFVTGAMAEISADDNIKVKMRFE